jgi:hypothetical protein
MSEAQIIEKCDGDGELVKIWINFLKDREWLVKDKFSNAWVLTNEGIDKLIHYYRI